MGISEAFIWLDHFLVFFETDFEKNILEEEEYF